MGIEQFEFEDEGLKRVFENPKWMVGIKNWKPANDIANIDCIERHNETDELFVLLDGQCVLLFAKKENDKMIFDSVKMEQKKVYNIPKSLWHNTITTKNAKLVLIEDSNTGMENSDVRQLTDEEIDTVKKLAGKYIQ